MSVCPLRCVRAVVVLCGVSAGAASGQVIIQPGTPRPAVTQPGVVVYPQVSTVPGYQPYTPYYQPWQPYPPPVPDYRRWDVYPPYSPYPFPLPFVPNRRWDRLRPYPVPKSFCMPLRASFIVSSGGAAYQPVASAPWSVVAPPVTPYLPQFSAVVSPANPVVVGGVILDQRPWYGTYPTAVYPPVYIDGGVPVGVWPGAVAGYGVVGGTYVGPTAPVVMPSGAVIHPGPSGFIPWLPPGYRSR